MQQNPQEKQPEGLTQAINSHHPARLPEASQSGSHFYSFYLLFFRHLQNQNPNFLFLSFIYLFSY